MINTHLFDIEMKVSTEMSTAKKLYARDSEGYIKISFDPEPVTHRNKSYSSIQHIQGFVNPETADKWFAESLTQIPFQECEWKAGKNLPRLVFRYSDDVFGTNKLLDDMIRHVESVHDSKVSGVWCNWYRNGNDYTPYHQDSYSSHVFTLSLGGTRRFLMKPIQNGGLLKYDLKNGDGFYFTPEANTKHKHSVPKTKKYSSDRVSIVFFMTEPFPRKKHISKVPLTPLQDDSLECTSSEEILELTRIPNDKGGRNITVMRDAPPNNFFGNNFMQEMSRMPGMSGMGSMGSMGSMSGMNTVQTYDQNDVMLDPEILLGLMGLQNDPNRKYWLQIMGYNIK